MKVNGSCANAIAVIAPPSATLRWDAQIEQIDYPRSMTERTQGLATVKYRNIGTETWNASTTKLVTSRPDRHRAKFYTRESWATHAIPAPMMPSIVKPGETGSFKFAISAPGVTTPTVYQEHFNLTNARVGRFGPGNSEVELRILVNPPAKGPGHSFVVASRSGGEHTDWYSDNGFSDSETQCEVVGASQFGTRTASTHRKAAGAKSATWAPEFPAAGNYNVYVAWGAGADRRGQIAYRVKHAGGGNTFIVDQTDPPNTWKQLGKTPFLFGAGRGLGSVTMSNSNVDVPGAMYAGPLRFEFVPDARGKDWALY